MTPEQDKVNNYLIALKEFSDKHPEYMCAFTVLIDVDGNAELLIANGVSGGAVRRIALGIGFGGIADKT